uniref:hypothetical protein n=1 Tax=Enterococcus mundtii TaxID=53346 RepID=UPI0021B0ED2F|nr:hypothetical protein [Enterococcus mundtii]
MKNLKKLWGTLISIVVFGAIGFIGMDLVNVEQPISRDYSESVNRKFPLTNDQTCVHIVWNLLINQSKVQAKVKLLPQVVYLTHLNQETTAYPKKKT